MTRLFSSERFDTSCRIEVQQNADHFHAHVDLDGDLEIHPGDRVHVHGAPIVVAFGENVILHRNATIHRAGILRQAWTKFAGQFELTELYEVSFTPGRL
jgi:hypothetical protein